MIRCICNACSGSRLEKVIDLGMHPNADIFLSREDLFLIQEKFSLVVDRCLDCGHIQNRYHVHPENRYTNIEYSYTSDHSSVSIKHFRELAKFATVYANLTNNSLVIEPGSNVGLLLKEINVRCEAQVIGVDPSPNIVSLANQNGINTICSFFNTNSSITLPTADLIIGCNVLNHVDDPRDLFRAADHCLADNGYIIIEVPSADILIQDCLFDTIYHEHVNYFTPYSLFRLGKLCGYNLEKVDKVDYMGGSLRACFRRERFKNLHNTLHLNTVKKKFEYDEFHARAILFKKKLLLNLLEIDESLKGNSSIVFLGAATKGNTLLNFINPPSGIIKGIADVMPLKFDKYTPGTRIKIFREDQILSTASHVFITAWNLRDILIPKISMHKCTLINITP